MGLTAFVLGGGGILGAAEAGMLQALAEHGVTPDLVIGSSVGAINGAAYAYEPGMAGARRLTAMWTELGSSDVFGAGVVSQIGTLARSGTHLYDNDGLRTLLGTHLRATRIEDLAVPFQCVAASIERAAERWFSRGPVVDAVLASSAVPGLLPPVVMDGEHYLDGGLVDSVPVGRALALGARTVYVLHVGRLEQPLRAPRRPWEVAGVAFEIARRHRFARDMADLSEDVRVHVLPTGALTSDGGAWTQYLRRKGNSRTHARIEQSYQACADYLVKERL
jgi:NTE family protein